MQKVKNAIDLLLFDLLLFGKYQNGSERHSEDYKKESNF